MKMTPFDMRQQSFTSAFRGYDKNEVNDFIQRITREYEDMFSANKKYELENKKLREQLKDYENIEKTLKETLISVQQTSGDIRGNAEKEAELVVKESELKAEKILEMAREEKKEIARQIEFLKKQKRLLKMDLKGVLKNYIEALDLVEKKTENNLIVGTSEKIQEQEKNILNMRRKMLKSDDDLYRKKEMGAPVYRDKNDSKRVSDSRP